jgi:hypothetical protein
MLKRVTKKNSTEKTIGFPIYKNAQNRSIAGKGNKPQSSFLYITSGLNLLETGPSSSMVQDTCLGRTRSWVQIPAAPPQTNLGFLALTYVCERFFRLRFIRPLRSRIQLLLTCMLSLHGQLRQYGTLRFRNLRGGYTQGCSGCFCVREFS